MTNINNNNLPPIEEVREIKYEVPSYEEFMKTYQTDESLNYADLGGGSVGEAKGMDLVRLAIALTILLFE